MNAPTKSIRALVEQHLSCGVPIGPSAIRLIIEQLDQIEGKRSVSVREAEGAPPGVPPVAINCCTAALWAREFIAGRRELTVDEIVVIAAMALASHGCARAQKGGSRA